MGREAGGKDASVVQAILRGFALNEPCQTSTRFQYPIRSKSTAQDGRGARVLPPGRERLDSGSQAVYDIPVSREKPSPPHRANL